MKHEELFEQLRADPTVVPFVGAGLAIPAGVPSVGRLSIRLADQAEVDRGDLEEVAEAAIARIGLPETQRAVARIIAARTPAADPKLIKLSQWPAQRLLTTNYDEAIETAIRATGREAESLSFGDTRALTPAADKVKVIHLHGQVKDPASIILPGKSTDALTESDEFLTQVRAMMQPGPVLYLGFSFAESEIHLRGILKWLRRLQHPRPHLLVLPSTGLAGREEDLEELREVPEVDITTYTPDPSHSFVGQVAAVHAFRPDATGANVEALSSPEPKLYVLPALVREEEGDGVEEIQGKVWGAEQGWSGSFVNPFDLPEQGDALVIASPGMGKTEMLNHLARYIPQYESIVVSSRLLAAELAKEPTDDPGAQLRAVASAIANGRAGREETPRPDRSALDDSTYLFLVDDFDQGPTGGREAAAEALLAAREQWPHHRWIVCGRPSEECEILARGGFEKYRIFPSERWGERYLEARGLPKDRVEWLLSAQVGFGSMIGIPLFAAEAGNQLLDNEQLPATPLELILSAQRRSIRAEAARRHGSTGVDLNDWLRRLAVGLELRNRLEASVEELASVPGHGDLDGQQIRKEMVRASLLIDSEGNAAFTRRTLQEALCAEAILSSAEPLAGLELVAVAEVAGESQLRSDMDFTIDLVFESADRDLRETLRGLDELRWASTVIVHGSEADGAEALDLLLAEAERLGHRLGRFAHGLRAPLQAVRAIARAWPKLIAERRDRLIGRLDEGDPERRFDALWVLGAQATDPDPSWLIPLIGDEDDQIRLTAARAAASWQYRDAVDALRQAIRVGELTVRKRILLCLLELVDEPGEIVEIIAATLNDGRLLAETAREIDERIDLDGYLSLLGRHNHNAMIWEWLLGRTLDLAAPDDWTDSRVEELVAAVIRHDGDPQVALDPRLTKVVEEHLETALDAARTARFQRPPAFRGYAMFHEVPPERLEGEEDAGIREAAERAVSADELQAWRRPKQLDWRELSLARLEEADLDATQVLDPQIRWPIEEMSEHQKARLAELAEQNMPAIEIDLNVEPYFHDEEQLLALGALNAAAQLGLPLERNRWLALMRSPNVLRTADYVADWLSASYTDDYDTEIGAYIEEIPDGRALSVLIAMLPREARDAREAIARRLDQFTDDVPEWADAVGMLTDRDDDLQLLARLRNGNRTEQQEDTLRARLADKGETRAQLELLDRFIATVEVGGHLPEPPWWRTPAADQDLLERLGDLLIAIGTEGRRSKHWDLAAGLLGNSPSAHAVAVIDRVGDELGVVEALSYTRHALVRRLAATAVLERLPDQIAEAAMVLEPDAQTDAASQGSGMSGSPAGLLGCLSRLLPGR